MSEDSAIEKRPPIGNVFKRKSFWISVGLLFIFLLRESGILGFSYYSSSADYSVGGYYMEESDRNVLDMTSSSGGDAVKTDLQTGTALALCDALRQALVSGDYLKNYRIVINVENIDLSGYYWLPFYKNGVADFEVIWLADRGGSRTDVVAMHRKGTCKLSVNGICSVFEFRRLITQQIADVIAQEIDREIAKRETTGE